MYYKSYKESSSRVNVRTTSPKCLETKNPATAGLVEPEAFHSFIPTVPRHLRCCDWISG